MWLSFQRMIHHLRNQNNSELKEKASNHLYYSFYFNYFSNHLRSVSLIGDDVMFSRGIIFSTLMTHQFVSDSFWSVVSKKYMNGVHSTLLMYSVRYHSLTTTIVDRLSDYILDCICIAAYIVYFHKIDRYAKYKFIVFKLFTMCTMQNCLANQI